jgi:hypothetical protein
MNGVVTSLYKKTDKTTSPKVKLYIFPKNHDIQVLEEIGGCTEDTNSIICNEFRSGPIHIVNMSYGSDAKYQYKKRLDREESQAESVGNCFSDYYKPIKAMNNTLFVIAAGNENGPVKNKAGDGICPAMMSGRLDEKHQLDNVVTVGGVAVSNLDNSGEVTDHHTIHGNNLEPADKYSCQRSLSTPNARAGDSVGSNCGNEITITAPGEEVLTLGENLLDYQNSAGTSFAAPIVTGVAAILQSIAPYDLTDSTDFDKISYFSPTELKEILLGSSDNISEFWKKGDTWREIDGSGEFKNPVGRINALKAVQSVLYSDEFNYAFVADHSKNAIVRITIDPLSGKIDDSDPVNVLRLTWKDTTGDNVTGSPVAVLSSPVRDELYALVNTDNSNSSAGVMVINTNGRPSVTGFIPLENISKQVTKASFRFGESFALSRDGRLMYINLGNDIAIVNIELGRQITSIKELPSHYKTQVKAGYIKLEKAFSGNIKAVRDILGNSERFVDLALSKNGKYLYVGIASYDRNLGGRAIKINVDLYTETELGELATGLQTDLSSYFALAKNATNSSEVISFELNENQTRSTPRDELKSIAVGVDPVSLADRGLYLIHGGGTFIPNTSTSVELEKAIEFPRVFGVSAAINIKPSLESLLQEGLTLDSSPGLVTAYDLDTASLDSAFTRGSRFGSTRSIIDQNEDIFASRPFDIAIRGDGDRAIVPFFTTGNFGIMDLAVQREFSKKKRLRRVRRCYIEHPIG